LSSVFEQPQTTKKRGGRQTRPRAALRQLAPRAASYTTRWGTTNSRHRSRGVKAVREKGKSGRDAIYSQCPTEPIGVENRLLEFFPTC